MHRDLRPGGREVDLLALAVAQRRVHDEAGGRGGDDVAHERLGPGGVAVFGAEEAVGGAVAAHLGLDEDVARGVVLELEVLGGVVHGGVEAGGAVVAHLVAVGAALEDGQPGEVGRAEERGRGLADPAPHPGLGLVAHDHVGLAEAGAEGDLAHRLQVGEGGVRRDEHPVELGRGVGDVVDPRGDRAVEGGGGLGDQLAHPQGVPVDHAAARALVRYGQPELLLALPQGLEVSVLGVLRPEGVARPLDGDPAPVLREDPLRRGRGPAELLDQPLDLAHPAHLVALHARIGLEFTPLNGPFLRHQ
ncbi:hypothetical protein Mterra_02797 [Calidithermus terrae]|uniref:Uncharacterized protein n=1 Tax=Calidithermus terrae TaxID=1408545 RepID=A0A399EGB5_9DEIN|nr:hypothetical protein Mterra_02797 [Calidithermus terrae]